MKTPLKKFGVIIAVAITLVSFQDCKKSDSPTPSAVQSFTCDINGTAFTPTSINGLTATYSSSSITQVVRLVINSDEIGTYSLSRGVTPGYAECSVGPNPRTLTTYYTNIAPFIGTLTINSNNNGVISGTFSFATVSLDTASVKGPVITNGSFANIKYN